MWNAPSSPEPVEAEDVDSAITTTRKRRLILVTGAPRSGTTPVGNMLAKCEGAVALYEPLGLTGLSRVELPFPIAGNDLGIAPGQLRQLAEDLAEFRFGELKAQVRRGRSATLFTAIFGSRTMHSFRLARLQPWSRIVIWKDPHAILLAPDLVDAGVDIVVTVRAARAHAGSYKRLGWRAKAAEVYPRWSARYGRCPVCEVYLDRADEKIVAAALLWRMSYLPLVRTGTLSRVRLVTSADLQASETDAYRSLCDDLALAPTPAFERALTKPRREVAAADLSKKTHDWTRSVASVNSYWKDVLSDDEVDTVDRITSDLMPLLFEA